MNATNETIWSRMVTIGVVKKEANGTKTYEAFALLDDWYKVFSPINSTQSIALSWIDAALQVCQMAKIDYPFWNVEIKNAGTGYQMSFENAVCLAKSLLKFGDPKSFWTTEFALISQYQLGRISSSLHPDAAKKLKRLLIPVDSPLDYDLLKIYQCRPKNTVFYWVPAQEAQRVFESGQKEKR